MKKVFLVAAVAVTVCMGSVAQAAIQFSKADLMSMELFLPLTSPVASFPNPGWSAATTGTGMTDSVNYNGSLNTLSGLAGATGNLPTSAPGPLGAPSAFYALPAPELAAFNALLQSTGETQLSMVVHNDNDDAWQVGIWVIRQGNLADPSNWSLDDLELASDTSGLVTIDIPALGFPPALAQAGVYVILPAGQISSDTYHASWGVPEPGSILVWGALGLISLAAGRRNRG